MSCNCLPEGYVSALLSFQKMITPIVIRVLFWIGVLVVVCFGIKQMATKEFAGGIVVILLGPVAVRVAAELLLMPFITLERVTEVRDALNKPVPEAEPAAPRRQR